MFNGTLNWQTLAGDNVREWLEKEALPAYLQQCRWFGGKARTIQQIEIESISPITEDPASARLAFVKVTYFEGEPELYMIPMQIAVGNHATTTKKEAGALIITHFGDGEQEGVLYEPIKEQVFHHALLKLIQQKASIKSPEGILLGHASPILQNFTSLPPSQLLGAEQSNSSIVYGKEFFLKLYRKIEPGINPDMELSQFLTEKQNFEHTPPFGGSFEFKKTEQPPLQLGLLLGFIPNEGDAWTYTLESVGRFYERVLETRPILEEAAGDPDRLHALTIGLIADVYPERAKQLGLRTAQMHLALASDTEDPAFAPEPFSILYQRSVYQSLHSSLTRSMELLRKQLPKIPDAQRPEAERLLGMEKLILQKQECLLHHKIQASKIRIHGDYHLGQVLNTGKDFVIIDFEGEPMRPFSERKLKHSPLRDVAGMLRSFHYAAYCGLSQKTTLRPEDIVFIRPWAEYWARYIGHIFLKSYIEATLGSPILPANPEDLSLLLDVFLMDKALYEVCYELNNRPDWVMIPVRGILGILENTRP